MPGKLANLIRSKYPGAYDDLDDATLERQVLAKYPQYADLAKDDAAPTAQPQLRSRTGALYTPPTESGAGDFARGVAEQFDPRGIVGAAKAAYQDPVGTVKAVATSPLRLMGEMVTNPAHALGTIGGMVALPTAMRGAGEVLEANAPNVYRSALKPRQSLEARNPGMNISQIGVDKGIVVGTKAGLENNAGILGQLRGRKIAAAAHNTDPVDISTIADALESLKGEYDLGLSAPEDVGAIDKVQGRLIAKPAVVSGASGYVRTMPVNKAVGTIGAIDKKLRGKFGREGGPEVEAMKTVRHGLSQDVNTTAPEIGSLNSEIGERAVLQKALKNAYDRDQNRNFFNTMDTGIASAVGGATWAATHNPELGFATALGTRLAEIPAVKSGGAILMDRTGRAISNTDALRAALIARLAANATQRGNK